MPFPDLKSQKEIDDEERRIPLALWLVVLGAIGVGIWAAAIYAVLLS